MFRPETEEELPNLPGLLHEAHRQDRRAAPEDLVALASHPVHGLTDQVLLVGI